MASVPGHSPLITLLILATSTAFNKSPTSPWPAWIKLSPFGCLYHISQRLVDILELVSATAFAPDGQPVIWIRLNDYSHRHGKVKLLLDSLATISAVIVFSMRDAAWCQVFAGLYTSSWLVNHLIVATPRAAEPWPINKRAITNIFFVAIGHSIFSALAQNQDILTPSFQLIAAPGFTAVCIASILPEEHNEFLSFVAQTLHSMFTSFGWLFTFSPMAAILHANSSASPPLEVIAPTSLLTSIGRSLDQDPAFTGLLFYDLGLLALAASYGPGQTARVNFVFGVANLAVAVFYFVIVWNMYGIILAGGMGPNGVGGIG